MWLDEEIVARSLHLEISWFYVLAAVNIAFLFLFPIAW
jgi:hypothetical protein